MFLILKLIKISYQFQSQQHQTEFITDYKHITSLAKWKNGKIVSKTTATKRDYATAAVTTTHPRQDLLEPLQIQVKISVILESIKDICVLLQLHRHSHTQTHKIWKLI